MADRLRPIEGLDTCYLAVPASVGAARSDVARLAQLAGADEDMLDDVKLAVSEAMSNAVMHAYKHDRAGAILLTAAAIAGELTVLVADDGCGLGYAGESEGLGLGLGLIAQMCDSLIVMRRSSGGTQVEMRFRIEGFRPAVSAPRGLPQADQSERGSLSSATRPASPRFSTTT